MNAAVGAPTEVRDRLALPLDVGDLDAALEIARIVAPWFGMAKVGYELYAEAGPESSPGIRPAGADPGDQARIVTPAAAVRSGADWLVVGRPATGATDPGAAAASIAAEVGEALVAR